MFGDAEADLEALRGFLAAQDRSLPAFEATRIALAEFSDRIGTQINLERSRVIAASPTLSARALQEREDWGAVVAAELATRRERAEPDAQDRLASLLVLGILVSAVREWSRGEWRPAALRIAMDRAASAAVDILQPARGED